MPLKCAGGAKNLTVSTIKMTNTNMYMTKKPSLEKRSFRGRSYNVGTEAKCLEICESLEKKDIGVPSTRNSFQTKCLQKKSQKA